MKSAAKTAKKPRARIARDRRFSMTMKPYGEVLDGTVVQFGGVTVVAPKPARNVIKKQIVAGKQAARKLTVAVATPGVRLKNATNTPVFRADPRDSSLVVRVLNGETSRGHFVEGKFVKVA